MPRSSVGALGGIALIAALAVASSVGSGGSRPQRPASTPLPSIRTAATVAVIGDLHALPRLGAGRLDGRIFALVDPGVCRWHGIDLSDGRDVAAVDVLDFRRGSCDAQFASTGRFAVADLGSVLSRFDLAAGRIESVPRGPLASTHSIRRDGTIVACAGSDLRLLALGGRQTRQARSCPAAEVGGRLLVAASGRGPIVTGTGAIVVSRRLLGDRRVLAISPSAGLAIAVVVSRRGHQGATVFYPAGRRYRRVDAPDVGRACAARAATDGSALAVEPCPGGWVIARADGTTSIDRVGGSPIRDVAFAPRGSGIAVATDHGIVLLDPRTLGPIALISDEPATRLVWVT